MIFTSILCTSFKFDIAIVGASGNLGRELVYQSIVNYDANVLGLTTQNNVFYKPSRLDSFNSDNKKKEFKSTNLVLENYWSHIKDDYEHIVFCTSAKPFQKDYSSELFGKFLCHLSPKCKSISLVSAFGAGKSIDEGNLGIQIMDRFYLKDVYKSKNIQETLLKNYDKDLKKYVYRPKALSFGNTLLDSTPRKTLAQNILECIF
jgi:hypothetical protein